MRDHCSVYLKMDAWLLSRLILKLAHIYIYVYSRQLCAVLWVRRETVFSVLPHSIHHSPSSQNWTCMCKHGHEIIMIMLSLIATLYNPIGKWSGVPPKGISTFVHDRGTCAHRELQLINFQTIFNLDLNSNSQYIRAHVHDWMRSEPVGGEHDCGHKRKRFPIYFASCIGDQVRTYICIHKVPSLAESLCHPVLICPPCLLRVLAMQQIVHGL